MVNRINDAVAERLTGAAHEYIATDFVEDDDGSFFKTEVLHSINLPEIPPHKLKLKKGIPSTMM